ncbi:DNA repair protein RecO [Kiritimatiellota bacterium B12222]|nr:DNA repair protein RecO [Kiritimatiellota bacterium B12222]
MSLLSDPIVADEAIVLRWFPVTDSSRIVVWFTSRYGRISTLIKGSQRPKSWILGQYDLFYTCELLFYSRANEDLHLIRECSPIHPRSGLRHNWRACAGASYVADVLYRISPPLVAAGEIYALAQTTLNQLNAGSENPALLFWFELKVLADLGISPDLSLLIKGPVLFDYAEGRVVHAHKDAHPQASHLSGGCLSVLRALSEIDDPSKVSRLRLQPGQLRELARHLSAFSAWHLDLTLPSRNRAIELMTR